MKFIIDRFEGEFAVVELPDGKTAPLPKAVIPSEAKEGDVIRIEVEQAETAARKETIEKKMSKLFKD